MLSYPFDEFGKPLARALRETPQPRAARSCACRQLRPLPQRRAPARGLLRPRQWPEARPEPRHRAAARPRPRDRRNRGRRRPRRQRRRGGRPPRRLPVDRLHRLRALQAGSRGAVHGASRPRHQPRRRLRRPCAGAASTLSVRLRPAARGRGLHLRLLGADRLQRAQEVRAARPRRRAAHHRRRRRRPVGRAHGGGSARRQAGRGRDRSRQMGPGPRRRRRRLPGPRAMRGAPRPS